MFVYYFFGRRWPTDVKCTAILEIVLENVALVMLVEPSCQINPIIRLTNLSTSILHDIWNT